MSRVVITIEDADDGNVYAKMVAEPGIALGSETLAQLYAMTAMEHLAGLGEVESAKINGEPLL